MTRERWDMHISNLELLSLFPTDSHNYHNFIPRFENASMAQINEKPINRWTARIIPLVLIGVVGYATYVVVVLLSSMYSDVCGASSIAKAYESVL